MTEAPASRPDARPRGLVRAAVLIAEKDLKSRIRDRSALIFGIVVPLGLAFIFNAIFGGISGNSLAINLGVVVADHGPVGQEFIHQLDSLQRTGLIKVHAQSSAAAARTATANGTVLASIVIPAGFSGAVMSQRPATMTLIENAGAPVTAQIVNAITAGFTGSLNRIRLSVATVIRNSAGGVSRTGVGQLISRAQAAQAPVAVNDISASTKELDNKSFFSAGMAVFFMFFTVSFGVTGLLAERNDGTLARLLAAPIPRASVLAGKLITSFALGILSMAVLVIATSLLFGASWGNPVGVALLVVAATLAAVGIMALIATFAKNSEQATNWQSVVAVILGLLGGTFFPVALAPGILSRITFIAPQAWFLRGLGDLRGGDLSVIWTPIAALLVFAVVTGAVALVRLGRLAEA